MSVNDPSVSTPTLRSGEKPRRSLLSRINAVVTLEVAGLSAIVVAFGMWELPFGVGAGGVAALVLAWRVEGR